MRTYVYVDGYNLYHGALEGTPWKWLDLAGVCKDVLGKNYDVKRVKYFTSIIDDPRDDSASTMNEVWERLARL